MAEKIDCNNNHIWIPLLGVYKKKSISTSLFTCLICGDLKVGAQTIKISQFRLDMGKLPINNAGIINMSENASIALDPAGSADGKYTGITVTGTAGETLVFGDVIVLDVTASKWFKGDVSIAAGNDGDLRGGTGMCVLAAAADSATTILLTGICRADVKFPTLTVGSVVYATTSGDITKTQPTTANHIIKVLGYALTTHEIYFNPSPDYITHVA